jgi:hypothetical protein
MKEKGFYETDTLNDWQWEVIQANVDGSHWRAADHFGGTISGLLQLLVGEVRRLRRRVAMLELTDTTPYECPKCEGTGRNPKEE